MMGKLQVGQRVRWTSGASGKTVTKVGSVETIVPAGAGPPRKGLRDPGAARDHVSYVVRTDDGKAYWPRVRDLESVQHSPDPDHQDGFVAQWTKAIGEMPLRRPDQGSPARDEQRLIEAFKAGVRWCAKNGADNWHRLEEDAATYAETGQERDRGGFVVHHIKGTPP